MAKRVTSFTHKGNTVYAGSYFGIIGYTTFYRCVELYDDGNMVVDSFSRRTGVGVLITEGLTGIRWQDFDYRIETGEMYHAQSSPVPMKAHRPTPEIPKEEALKPVQPATPPPTIVEEVKLPTYVKEQTKKTTKNKQPDNHGTLDLFG